MSTITLVDIRELARAIGQVPDSTQMTNPEVDKRINRFYTLRLPQELWLNKLKGTFSFYTTPNVDTYTFPQSFTTLEQPCYVSGYQAAYFQDKGPFYSLWPQILFNENDLIVEIEDG